MRAFAPLIMGFAVCVALWSGVDAQEGKDKEVTLKGTITCPKCDLMLQKACYTVLVVKGDDKKEKIYWFDKKANKEYHGDICKAAKEGSVVGIVEKDAKDEKKLLITVKKLEFAK